MSPRRRVRLALAAAVLATATGAHALAAQEFSSSGRSWDGDARGMLDLGLPPVSGGLALETATISWFGIADLVTRSLAVGCGRGGVRAAAGLAATGSGDIRWDTVALAAGWSHPSAGFALRGAARRFGATDEAIGVEAGAGAWIGGGPGVRLWAAAPRIWSEGERALDRGFEVGVAGAGPGARGWLIIETLPASGGAPRLEHGAGLSLAFPPLEAWITLRDQPARGGLGVAARRGPLRLAAEAEGHPVLGQTLRLAAAWTTR